MHVTLRLEGEDHPREHDIWVTRTEGTVELEVDGERYEATVDREAGELIVDLDGERYAIVLDDATNARIDGRPLSFEIPSFSPGGAPGEHGAIVEGEGAVLPPMPGKILEVHVEEGDEVEMGDELAVLEAMKMQSTITAGRSGTVLSVNTAAGDAVEGKEILFEIGDPD